MEMISTGQMVSVPLWQILAFLGVLTFCTLVRKSIGTVVITFLFCVHWVFWQNAKVIKTEGQEYTLMAFFFGFGLICALSIAWQLYKADHYD